MRLLSIFNSRHALAAGLLLVLSSQPVAAQLLPAAHAQAYDFLVVTVIEAPTKNMAKLLLAPAFNGRSEIQLEPVGGFSAATILERARHNDELLAQSLSELSVAGWELIQVAPAPFLADKTVSATRYLLRKAKS